MTSLFLKSLAVVWCASVVVEDPSGGIPEGFRGFYNTVYFPFLKRDVGGDPDV